MVAMYVGNKPEHFGDKLDLSSDYTHFISRKNPEDVFPKELIMKDPSFVLFFKDRETFQKAKETNREALVMG